MNFLLFDPNPMVDAEVEEKRRATKIWVEDGIVCQRLAPQEFGGEHRQNGAFYLSVLWTVSLWAKITNSAQTFGRFLRKDKLSIWNAIKARNLKKAVKRCVFIWVTTSLEMGRDPNHVSSSFVDRFSRYNHQAKWGAAGWKSLDVFYNYWEEVFPRLVKDLESWLTGYWIERMANRQAVTNRLKIAVNLLVGAFSKFSGEPEIRLLSVASGSAQAVIQAMQRCPNLNVKAILIDADQTALDEAGKSIAEAGLTGKFELKLGKTEILEEVCKTFRPHVVEMIGFLDYRPDEKAIQLIGRIWNILPTGGVFITCNIRNNPEMVFLHWVLIWPPMIYRSARQLGKMVIGGGFEREKTKLFYEPFEIHGIAVAVK